MRDDRFWTLTEAMELLYEEDWPEALEPRIRSAYDELSRVRLLMEQQNE